MRLITFDSILAFTPESACDIDKCMIDKDAIGDFPAAGKINSQRCVIQRRRARVWANARGERQRLHVINRWVMDASYASIAPFICPMMGLPCLSPVGCYPFLSKLGDGHISEALVLRGYNAGCCKGRRKENSCRFSLWPR